MASTTSEPPQAARFKTEDNLENMQSMYIAVAAIMALPILAFVLYPLYRRPATQKAPGGSPDLSEREQNARQALQEVEFDFQLGNLDEKDYRSMRTRYMNRALAEMRTRHKRAHEIDEQIEQELRALRNAEEKKAGSDGHI